MVAQGSALTTARRSLLVCPDLPNDDHQCLSPTVTCQHLPHCAVWRHESVSDINAVWHLETPLEQGERWRWRGGGIGWVVVV